jgi:hypothetical protein
MSNPLMYSLVVEGIKDPSDVAVETPAAHDPFCRAIERFICSFGLNLNLTSRPSSDIPCCHRLLLLHRQDEVKIDGTIICVYPV